MAYTLTRPDVYNAIMAIPGYSQELERELGVDKSRGMDSYDYMLTYEAIAVDSRMMWRAKSRDGFYWKTFDVFTQGESDYQRWNIDQAYRMGEVTYPFWAHPIPKFIKNQGGTTPEDLSYVATLPLGAYSFDTRGPVGRYTGADGPQQSAEEVIFSLPNGLQGYVLFGAWNQRRVDAFVNIVRDPRILRNVSDNILNKMAGFGRTGGIDDHRLNTASSCIGCHIDGMNRSNNDLRDWLDAGGGRLPKGQYGVDGWIRDDATVARVRELYPPSSKMRVTIENDRRIFLNAMAQIKQEMILGGGGIPEGNLPEGTVSGTAGVGRGNYFGPGAPAGPRYHHYVFELYALSAMLNLPADATRAQLLDAMKDIIVGKAAYVGRFRQ